MKTKMMIALVAITMLASCGNNETKEVETVDTLVVDSVDTTTVVIDTVVDSIAK